MHNATSEKESATVGEKNVQRSVLFDITLRNLFFSCKCIS